MIVVVVVAFIALMRIVSNNYIKVPPNEVAIFYGRKYVTKDGQQVGFRVVTGGAKLKIPILESVQYLPLNVFSIDLQVQGVPNKDGVLVNVRGVANVKILSDEVSLFTACERFLGMGLPEIKEIAYKNLEGHLRAIIGRLTVEEIVSDRTKFNQEVLREAAEDLHRIGLGIDVLTVQEIDDEYGYIKALGQKRTAEVKRDATIGTAEAERDATLRATTAKREAEQKANQNLALIAEAEKERDVKKAQYFAEVQREQATASQAGPLAEAEAKKEVVIKQVEVQRVKTLKEAEVALAEAERQQNELLATIVRPAEAKKEAAIAVAEGERQATVKTADGERQKRELEGQGDGAAIRARGQAEADIMRMKVLAQGESEAQVTKLKVLAQGQSEAEVIRLKLLAEAEGIEKKAEAFRKLDEAGRTLQILEVVRYLVPESLEKLAPVMAEISKPLGNVDRISIVDFGGNSGTGGGGVGRFAQTAPIVLTQFFEGLKAVGLDPSQLQKLLKVPSAAGAAQEAPELKAEVGPSKS
jgi:flotillin